MAKLGQLEDDTPKLKAAFEMFDTNKDGTVTREELRSVLDQVGYCLSEEDLQAFVDQADADNSGTITFDEFVEACHKSPSRQRVAKMKRLFRSLDVDGSGLITLKDLRRLVKESGAKDVPEDYLKNIILSMDKNGDKKVSFEEFAAHMTGQ